MTFTTHFWMDDQTGLVCALALQRMFDKGGIERKQPVPLHTHVTEQSVKWISQIFAPDLTWNMK